MSMQSEIDLTEKATQRLVKGIERRYHAKVAGGKTLEQAYQETASELLLTPEQVSKIVKPSIEDGISRRLPYSVRC